MRTELVTISSPPIEDRGAVAESDLASLLAIAQALPEDENRQGQVSTRVILGSTDANRHALTDLAVHLAETHLGYQPSEGSDVRLKYVTDADAYAEDQGRIAAATYWHHDYKLTDKGFQFLDATRFVIPLQRGTWAAVGDLTFQNAAVVGADEANEIGRKALLSSPQPVIIGEGGILVRSSQQPIGGEITLSTPARASIIPSTTSHRADRELPAGRLLFRMDAKPAKNQSTRVR